MQPSVFVTIDTETTGLDPERNSMIELAAVATNERGRLLDIFNERLSPRGDRLEIEQAALDINGHSANEIQHFPAPGWIIRKFSDFIESFKPAEITIVGHNAKFDVGFLESLYRAQNRFNAGLDLSHFKRVLCTQSLGYAYFGERMSLKQLGERLKIENRHEHSALGDAIQTSNVFHEINRGLGNELRRAA